MHSACQTNKLDAVLPLKLSLEACCWQKVCVFWIIGLNWTHLFLREVVIFQLNVHPSMNMLGVGISCLLLSLPVKEVGPI